MMNLNDKFLLDSYECRIQILEVIGFKAIEKCGVIDPWRIEYEKQV